MRKGGSAKVGSSLVNQILQLPYQARELRLLKNVDFFMSCFMNLCSVRSVDLFLLLMKPVELTSNEFTVQLQPVMSVIRCEYFCVFSVFRWSMFIVTGRVSSQMCKIFLSLSKMTMSGLRLVTDAQVSCNGASSCCFPTWQITEHFKLFFAHTVDNEIDDLHMYISVFSYVNNNSQQMISVFSICSCVKAITRPP